MSRKYLIRIKTGKKVTPQAPTGKVDGQYPSSWFTSHEGEKPALSITLTAKSLNGIRTIIKKEIRDNAMNPDNVKTFLFYYFSNVKEKLDSDWKSYGVTIGREGSEICPWDLLKVNRTDRAEESDRVQDTTNKDDSWMALYCLSIYRTIRASVNEYRAQITDRINSQLKAITPSASEMTEAVSIYLGWVNDNQYNMMVTAVDMFFNKFPNGPLANMRIGTTGSRYKDCAGLLSYGYIMRLLGMDELIELWHWVFVNAVGDDIDRLMKEGEELLENFSYFPYQVDMKLVLKSNYSAIMNPHFFEFVHLIGTILRSPRSMNARHINENQTMNIFMNAACVAYVYSHTFSLAQVYGVEGEFGDAEDSDDEEEGADTEQLIAKLTKSRDPRDWITLIKSIDNQMPEVVRNFVKNVGRSIKDPRDGTMEQYLQTMASSL